MIDYALNSDENEKRISIIVGHYGSGKTEFAVNYALKATKLARYSHIALIDLDIANPYFRSREKQVFLEARGIEVLSNTFGYDINLDLPAISARINGPLQDKSYRVIVDVGGDQTGARVLNQFRSQFKEEYELLCLINANRTQTASITGATDHILSIERETGLKITGLINNTHLLRETTFEDILKGVSLCHDLSLILDIPVKYHCCIEKFESDLEGYLLKNANMNYSGKVFRIDIIMRSSWLDK